MVTICYLQATVIQQMEWNVWRVLNNDTATISTPRCLKLYLECLSCNFLDQESVQIVAGSASSNESQSAVAFGSLDSHFDDTLRMHSHKQWNCLVLKGSKVRALSLTDSFSRHCNRPISIGRLESRL